jgi:hypothetical protein
MSFSSTESGSDSDSEVSNVLSESFGFHEKFSRSGKATKATYTKNTTKAAKAAGIVGIIAPLEKLPFEALTTRKVLSFCIG